MWTVRVRKTYNERQIEVVLSRWFRTQNVVVKTLDIQHVNFKEQLKDALEEARTKADALNNLNMSVPRNLRGRRTK